MVATTRISNVKLNIQTRTNPVEYDTEEPAVSQWSRPLYLFVGWLFVALGTAGAFLPVLPTTPFLLVALWAFTRSSPAAAAWLRAHPWLGSYIINWQDHGIIPQRAKFIALTMMSASLAWLVWGTDASSYVKVGVGLILLGAAAFVSTRPS